MSTRVALWMMLAALALDGRTRAVSSTQERVDGRRFAVRYGVLPDQGDRQAAFRSSLSLINQGTIPLEPGGWVLYFNSPQTIVARSLPPSVRATRVNGDFYKLEPTERFPGLAPGESLDLPFETEEATITESKAPSGFYFVFGGEPAPRVAARLTIEPFVTREQTQRSREDRIPVSTPEVRFEKDAALVQLPADQVSPIVPTPLVLARPGGLFAITAKTRILAGRGTEAEARYLARSLEPLLGAGLRVTPAKKDGRGAIRLSLGPLVAAGEARGAESYALRIDPRRGIEITGADRAGLFHGIQSLRALIGPEAYARPQSRLLLDAVAIEDAPRFHYRGLMLDVARHFQPKAAVVKLLELMSFYKLNTLHLHLTDDEGWRLAIAPLPELAEVGGRRGHTLDERDRLVPSFGSGPDSALSQGSGHYSRADFIEILREARDRHIEVVPEIEAPGHARAAIVAMRARNDPQYLLHESADRSVYRSVQGWTDNVMNVCQPSTYHFMRTVIDEITSMYAEAEVPLTTVHIGGDEVPAGVWEGSPACARLRESLGLAQVSDLHEHYVKRLHEILSVRGLTTSGWEEIALRHTAVDGQPAKVPHPDLQDGRVRAYVWNNVWGAGGEENAYKLANAGYDVVMGHAASLYFDLAYEKDPQEPGQHWAGFVDTRSAYEFAPFDLYMDAHADVMGRPIDPAVAFRDKVRLTARGERHILGIQGHLWGEAAKKPETMEYLIFPKLLGLAERAWAREPEWERLREPQARQALLGFAWNEFANRLGQRELPRLCALAGGVNYRLPLPGAVVRDGVLIASVGFPGLTIRYTTDGTEPDERSPVYGAPVPLLSRGTVKLKTFAPLGHSSRTSVLK